MLVSNQEILNKKPLCLYPSKNSQSIKKQTCCEGIPDAKLATTEKNNNDKNSHIGHPQSLEQKPPRSDSLESHVNSDGSALSSSMYVEFRHWQPVHMSP
jgi:hypothetical protein